MTTSDYARTPFLYLGGHFITNPITVTSDPKPSDPTIRMYYINLGHDIRVQFAAEDAANVARDLIINLYDHNELPTDVATTLAYITNGHLVNEEVRDA